MKVLIISHNSITTYQNMGKTLLSLFSSFDKSELCQLYIYPTVPDVDVCNSYYRVTDRDVFNSYFRFGRVNSRIITKDEINENEHSLYQSSTDADFYKKKKKNSLTLLCRDLMWRLSGWYNSSLEEWLEKETPTCIFLAPGESKFIYDVALSIAQKRNIGIFTYVCDEYYFVSKPDKLLDRIQLSLLKKKMMKTLKKSKGIITICDELADVYNKEFGTCTHTILTGSNYPIKNGAVIRQRISGITYMGNLSCNRYISIAEIGRALDEINTENGTDLKLYLYSSPLSDTYKSAFEGISSIAYSGYVTGRDFEEAFERADVLLHVEAFDERSIERVRHSMSTKIADALGSGKILFAYGPCNVASIKHLIRNNCAFVVTDKTKLKEDLCKLLGMESADEVITAALATARAYHSGEKNSRALYEILNTAE